jgi:hypothetical protein
MDPNPCTPSSKPPPPPPGRWGGGGGGVSGGKGGTGFHPTPPFPRLALPHLWAEPPNFGATIIFTTRPVQRSEKPSGQHNFFSTTPN